jgi:glyoxylase-like metal-dependent hydrolase (beta-lactamase superfamily II)
VTPPLPGFVEPLGDGIFAVDTGFHRDRFDAAYLVVEGGRAAFIDTGTANAVPRLLAALEATGVARAAVDFIIPTHVHLDHAGGVGQLAQALPGAQVVVHPRGARHLVDPSELWRGALAIYGQAQMDRAYGRLEPVPAARVRTTADDETIALAGRPLRFAHTPGHCLHHHCIWDERTRGWFTGDNFGMAYPEFVVAGRAFMFPTTTPVQFDPPAMLASIRRLLAKSPACMYLTHYGRIANVADCGARLETMLADLLAVVDTVRDAPDRHAALVDGLMALHVRRAREFGVALPDERLRELLHDDIALNAAGIGVWLERRARPRLA